MPGPGLVCCLPVQERRVHPRFRVHVNVQYRSTVVQASAPVLDMSVGGVFVETTAPLPVGTHIVLHPLSEASDEVPLAELRGKVVRAVEHGIDETAEQPAGMGVAFEPLGTKERDQVLALIERRAAEETAAAEASAAPAAQNAAESMDTDATIDERDTVTDMSVVPEEAQAAEAAEPVAVETGDDPGDDTVEAEPPLEAAADDTVEEPSTEEAPKRRSRRRKGRRRKKG